MKTKLFAVPALLACLVSLSATTAQAATTATANASADVVTAISITTAADLYFGKVVAGASLGTVVMSTGGVRSATGGVVLGNASGAAAASFSVTGENSATYSITLPSSITVTAGANNMTVDTFTSNPSGTGTLSGAGAQTVAVGATLRVAANQASGSYTGTFDVTVAYN